MDILGISALRNGTWIPAIANSVLHLDIKAYADAYHHYYDILDEFNSFAKAWDPMNENEDLAKVTAVIDFVKLNAPTLPAAPPPPGFPSSPNLDGWIKADAVTPQAPSFWKQIQGPCEQVVNNFKKVEWADIAYSFQGTPHTLSGISNDDRDKNAEDVLKMCNALAGQGDKEL